MQILCGCFYPGGAVLIAAQMSITLTESKEQQTANLRENEIRQGEVQCRDEMLFLVKTFHFASVPSAGAILSSCWCINVSSVYKIVIRSRSCSILNIFKEKVFENFVFPVESCTVRPCIQITVHRLTLNYFAMTFSHAQGCVSRCRPARLSSLQCHLR